MRRVGIGLFHPFFTSVGGAEKVIAELVGRLPEYQWILYCIKYDAAVEKYFPQLGNIEKRIIPAITPPFRLPSRFSRPEIDDLLSILSFRTYFKKNKLDIDLAMAHLSFGTTVSLYTSVPSVWYCHCPTRYLYEDWIQQEFVRLLGPTPLWASLLRRYLKHIETASVSRFKKIICNSQHMQKKVRRFFNASSIVVSPGVDIPHSSTPIRSDTFIIPGRLADYKRVDIAIEAMCLLRDIPDLRLKIIGQGAAKARLQALAEKHNLESVQFVDFVPDLSLEYDNALGVIYLPRDEDFGIVPVEAMAHGRPIIGSNEGGLKETIIDQVTGYLIEPEPARVADCMRTIFMDRALAEKLGAAGRARAADFSWHSFAARIDEQIKEALRNGME